MPFTAKVQKSYAVYKMIKPARLVQKCFETSILYIGKPCARIEVEKHFCTTPSWFLIILYNGLVFVLSGKLHVTSQQIYTTVHKVEEN